MKLDEISKRHKTCSFAVWELMVAILEIISGSGESMFIDCLSRVSEGDGQCAAAIYTLLAMKEHTPIWRNSKGLVSEKTMRDRHPCNIQW